METGETIRLDKWLWFARFYKTRSLAGKICRARKIRIDGQLIAKASAMVRVGNVLTFSKADKIWIVRVLALGDHRGPYSEASKLYEDLSPPPQEKQDTVGKSQGPLREPGSGRPTKKERRALEKLTGDGLD